MKKCSLCKKEKIKSSFTKNRSNKDGLSYYCKECTAKYFKKYNKNYRKQAKFKKYNVPYQKQYSLSYPKTKGFKKYRKSANYKAYRRKYLSLRMKTDSKFRILINLRNRITKALKNNQRYGHTLELLGCTINQLKKHLESQFKHKMSWKNHGTGQNGRGLKEWHIDHIRPCSSFDLTKPSEQRKCFNYKNLQPLWAKYNMQKANKS